MVRGPSGAGTALVVRRGQDILVSYRGRQYQVSPVKHVGPAGVAAASEGGEEMVKAAMPSAVVEVFVKEGQKVAEGEKLLVVEAMKMQITLTAPKAGVVKSLPVSAGDQVSDGQVLAVVG